MYPHYTTLLGVFVVSLPRKSDKYTLLLTSQIPPRLTTDWV